MKRIQRLALPVVTAYLWVMMILLGAIVLETLMIYPNVFSDPPASLELAMDFMSVRGAHDFFPPLGLLSWVLGAGAPTSGRATRSYSSRAPRCTWPSTSSR
jgi:hypothetical protein